VLQHPQSKAGVPLQEHECPEPYGVLLVRVFGIAATMAVTCSFVKGSTGGSSFFPIFSLAAGFDNPTSIYSWFLTYWAQDRRASEFTARAFQRFTHSIFFI
jgi:hypothetical protein